MKKSLKKDQKYPKISETVRKGLPSPEVVGNKYNIKIKLLNESL